MPNVIAFPSMSMARPLLEALAFRWMADGIATGFQWEKTENGDDYLMILGTGPDRDELLVGIAMNTDGRTLGAYNSHCRTIVEGNAQTVVLGLEQWVRGGWTRVVG